MTTSATLREYLQENNGLKGLEIVEPSDVQRAKSLFYRDGFVVVRDALSERELQSLRAGVQREVATILALDPEREGNRGSHRYSFGAVSLTGHLMHLPEWAMLLDLPTITPIVTAIFECDNYHARGGGGDFCLPGAVQYQPLHSDMVDRMVLKDKDGTDRVFGAFHDPEGQINYRHLPCPNVTCNFLVEDSTAINGPTRQIPGTQHTQQPIPSLADEPQWMKLSTVHPAPAGSAIIRDVRAWHGGTPNVSDEVRAIPNVEFYAPWFIEPQPRSVPRHIFDALSAHAQHVCRYIAAQPGEELRTGYHSRVGRSPFSRL